MKFFQIHISAISLFILMLHAIAFSSHSASASNLSKSSEVLFFDDFELASNTHSSTAELVGTSEHFEFFTNISGESDYWMEIKDSLEIEYLKLSSLWNRPGIEDIFSENEKIKVYYSKKEDITGFDGNSPTWKNGLIDVENLEIHISPLTADEQINFYQNLSKLAINEFSQLAISKKLLRDNNSYLPPYFLEGFGLYEMGIRPQRDSIIKYLSENPVPDFDFLKDTSGISNSLKKDLILSNIEGQILTPWSYLEVNAGASSFINGQWPHYLEYFYAESEESRIKLIGETEHFNFYWAESDTNHYAEVVNYFEDKYNFYVEKYKYEPNHKFNIVFFPSEQIGMDLTGYGNFNGGAGCGGDLVLELSPNYNYNEENYYSKYFGYEGMCAHEFFHVYYNHFMWEIPGGFWAEGTAEFSQCHSLNWELPPHSLWKIEWLFSDYKQKYNVEINLKHISENPNYEIDIYFLGNCFFEFLYENYGGYENIIKFFNEGMDYSVFNATYEEIDNGYIKYLKSLVNYIPPNILVPIPFDEPFDDFSNGWSKPSYINPDNWQINDGGMAGTNCARFYTSSDKNVSLESWLISPPLDASNAGEVNFSFDFARYGEGIEVEVFYTNKFEEFTDSTDWISVKSINMPTDWGWSNTGEITIQNPSDTMFIGLRKKSTGEQHLQLYIDNFEVNETITGLEGITAANKTFRVFPNPANSNSVVSFKTKSNGNVNLSIYDIQGRKISTLLDKNLHAGSHTIELGNQIQTSGVYFCKLSTEREVSTLKIVVK